MSINAHRGLSVLEGMAMDFPTSSKEDLEKNLTLAGEAWRNLCLETWIALADAFMEDIFDKGTAEEEEEEEKLAKEESVEEVILFDEVLHALVEIAFEAYKSDPDRCRNWIGVGLYGENETGLPPFLNMRAGSAHIELALFIERLGEISLSSNGLTLGRTLLLFHMAEGFIRPGMASAAFLLRVWMGMNGSFGDELLRNYQSGEFEMASYGKTRTRFIERISSARLMFPQREGLALLERFMDDAEAELTLKQIRNEIAHHNLDFLEGTVRLGWMTGYPKWDEKQLVTISIERMKEILWGMRGFVMTLMAWEIMMATVFFPPLDLDEFDASVIAEGIHRDLTMIRQIFQVWF